MKGGCREMRYFTEISGITECGKENDYTLAFFKKLMITDKIKVLTLLEYKRDKNNEVPMWCSKYDKCLCPSLIFFLTNEKDG